MTILIINGPNLNLLGIREVELYGHSTYQDLETFLKRHAEALDIKIEIHQTNFEGIVIDLMHYALHKSYDGIIVNAAALSHYSYAIYDAIKAIPIPVISVHLTDPEKRDESFRHRDVIAPACVTTYKGHGFDSYRLALEHLAKEVTS